jgi:4-hydroxythreonine-4-phosphate dehydrogenase
MSEMSLRKKITLFVTTGDTDGIGMEVATKALLDLGPQNGARFFVFTNSAGAATWGPLLQKRFPVNLASSLTEALGEDFDSSALTLILSEEAPVKWVEESARICLSAPTQFALVTGPLSKTGIQDAGVPFIGHTGLLKKISGARFLFQTYLGSQFNVLLVTDHIALQKVPRSLMRSGLLTEALKMSAQLKRRLRLKGKIALLALDPHAGEEGVIGNQDEKHRLLLKKVSGPFIGPLPADTAFEEGRRKTVGLYVALYHDQGLIPFKALHGFNEGVHLTLGLPFVRTSVDHGTAKDLYGKNKAQPGSMKHALITALQLLGKTP